MPYLVLILLLICFFKTFYYGLYEFKEKQNKSGGIAVCILAILRTYITKYSYYFTLYNLKYYSTILNSAYFFGSKFSLYSTSSNNAGISCLKYNNKGIMNCWIEG